MKSAFESLTFNEVKKWVEDKKQENLHLDFKLIINQSLSSDDRKNFSKSISGFGNSSGGLIVWGVATKKDPESGIDCAAEIRTVKDVRSVLSKFESMTGDASDPVVDGVLHRCLFDSHESDDGLVVTYIPESDRGPHMAKLGEDRFYKRSGDSFYKMEYYDIADMFGRRRKPLLHVVIGAKTAFSGINEGVISVSIQNTGKAVARYAGAFLSIENGDVLNATESLRNVSHLNGGRQTISCSNDHSVIHPNGISLYMGDVSVKRKCPGAAILIKVKCYCEDYSGKEERFIIE